MPATKLFFFVLESIMWSCVSSESHKDDFPAKLYIRDKILTYSELDVTKKYKNNISMTEKRASRFQEIQNNTYSGTSLKSGHIFFRKKNKLYPRSNELQGRSYPALTTSTTATEDSDSNVEDESYSTQKEDTSIETPYDNVNSYIERETANQYLKTFHEMCLHSYEIYGTYDDPRAFVSADLPNLRSINNDLVIHSFSPFPLIAEITSTLILQTKLLSEKASAEFEQYVVTTDRGSTFPINLSERMPLVPMYVASNYTPIQVLNMQGLFVPNNIQEMNHHIIRSFYDGQMTQQQTSEFIHLFSSYQEMFKYAKKMGLTHGYVVYYTGTAYEIKESGESSADSFSNSGMVELHAICNLGIMIQDVHKSIIFQDGNIWENLEFRSFTETRQPLPAPKIGDRIYLKNEMSHTPINRNDDLVFPQQLSYMHLIDKNPKNTNPFYTVRDRAVISYLTSINYRLDTIDNSQMLKSANNVIQNMPEKMSEIIESLVTLTIFNTIAKSMPKNIIKELRKLLGDKDFIQISIKFFIKYAKALHGLNWYVAIQQVTIQPSYRMQVYDVLAKLYRINFNIEDLSKAELRLFTQFVILYLPNFLYSKLETICFFDNENVSVIGANYRCLTDASQNSFGCYFWITQHANYLYWLIYELMENYPFAHESEKFKFIRTQVNNLNLFPPVIEPSDYNTQSTSNREIQQITDIVYSSYVLKFTTNSQLSELLSQALETRKPSTSIKTQILVDNAEIVSKIIEILGNSEDEYTGTSTNTKYVTNTRNNNSCEGDTSITEVSFMLSMFVSLGLAHRPTY